MLYLFQGCGHEKLNPKLSLDFVARSLSWCETGARTLLRHSGYAKASRVLKRLSAIRRQRLWPPETETCVGGQA